MRPRLAPCLLALVALASAGPARGAEPFLERLAEAEAQSRSTGKPIFLDAYTTWCAPCRRMDAEVFSRPEVRAMLAEAFVPLRLDMEQSDGQAVAERFGVAAYPTLLVFDAAGEIHRATGYLDAQSLAAFARASADPARNYRGRRARYDAGERDLGLLESLAAYAKAGGLSREREAYEYAYLRARGRWDDDDASLRMLEGPQRVDGPLFDSLVARRRQVSAHYGAVAVDERIARLLDDALFGALPAKPRAARRLIAHAYPQAVDSTYLRYRMRRAREAGKARAYGRAAVASQRRFPSHDPGELADLIYVFEERLPGWRTEEVAFWRKRLAALEGQ